MKITNTLTQEELKGLKYAPPKKFTPIGLAVNGEHVEGRFTNARGKSYSYFPVAGVSIYVPGNLDGAELTVDVPEGFSGPAWAEDRKSTYVPKRKKKEAAAEGESTDETATEASADAGVNETTEASDVTPAAPKQRRKRGE